jgi:type VI protein secretion system component VasK
MPRYERPLTQAERAELARIRQNRQIRRARSEIRDANYFSGAGKTLVVLVVGFLGLFWPLWVWHKPRPDGGAFIPDTTGWIAWAIWVAILLSVTAAVVSASKKAKATRSETAAEREQEQQSVSELRAQVLASNGVALSAIADPAMRERVAQIRATE